ncbi:MAG: hypothetical protein HYV38_01370 [Candidatus Levybacteria bacterium]|nr:hypothetical protein [Candidatus Levybacteria bacterium]
MPKLYNYVTKQDLKGLEKSLDKKFRKFHDDVMNMLDKIMKELEAMREESTIGAYQTRELREEVDEHEKRITKLETA